MAKIELTDRAHFDLQDIMTYSVSHFGKKVAEKYLDDIESALLLLETKQLQKQLILNRTIKS